MPPDSNSKSLCIIIPVCNERGNLLLLLSELEAVCASLPYNYSFIFVEDSSTDGTLEFIKEQAAQNTHIFYISLTKSFGHQNALKAGLDRTTADAVIMMDGDLQHPPSLLSVMIEKWRTEKYDVV